MAASHRPAAPEIASSVDAEWAFLEALAIGLPHDELVEAVERMNRNRPDWGYLIDSAVRNKMLAMLSVFITEGDVAAAVPIRIVELLTAYRAHALHRRTVWYAALFELTEALENAGVTAVARKGAAFEGTIYGGDASRWTGDLDFLVLPEEADRARAAAETLGYEQGWYDARTGALQRFSRKELVGYRLNPDHLPTMARLCDDEFVPVIELDFAMSLTWARAHFAVSVADVLRSRHRLEARTPAGGGRFWVASLPFQLIDTTLHLFREAWFDWWLDREQDVDLMKFGDVMRLWAQVCGADAPLAFRELLDRYAVTEPVAWVFEHCKRLFGCTAVSDLALDGVASEEFLASAAATGPGVAVWPGDMRVRLRDVHRSARPTQESHERDDRLRQPPAHRQRAQGHEG
jgi:Uncharacterised nucleotidyltransferase